MAMDTYPAGTVRALLTTEAVTPPTRAALEPRLQTDGDLRPHFFTQTEFTTLTLVCACLMPARETPSARDLALRLDRRLTAGDGDGWRYNVLPADDAAYRQGLAGLDEAAQIRHNQPFALLVEAQQTILLQDARRGDLPGVAWARMPAARFLEELQAELAEAYYSHPLAQEEIGYVGMADAPGWQRLGLNRLEAREPRPEGKGALEEEPDAAKGYGDVTHVPQDAAQGQENAPTPATSSAAPMRDADTLPGMTEISTEMKRYDLGEVVDALVIGTGAGGAPILARLAQAGLKVVALEAGPHWNPAKDFATDERAQEKLFWKDERLSAGDDALAFGANNSGVGVGGSTLHYTAYTPRPQPDDFRLHTEFGVGADWPLAYADLEPYLDEAEQFLGVSGPTPYPWGPSRRRGYPLAPLPLNGAAQLMQRGCEKLGLRVSPAPNAALSARYYQEGVGWRPACTNRGFCQAGCSVGAKASMDVTFIPVAVRAGAEIRPGCFVTEIETDKATGRVTGVVYIRDGRTERQACRHLFLCAGAIETPRLLLLNGIANGSGQVGRNFMAHTGLQIWAQFPEDVRPYKGIPGGLISEDTHRPEDADFAGGYLLQSLGVMPVTYASQLARGQGLMGEELRAHMNGYNHVAGINILGEGLPYAHNYLELSEEKDGRGLPKPRVHYTQGENERRLTAHADRTMRAIWEAAGAQDIWAFNRFAHTLGTCRMGSDPQASVVNAECRAHDVANLTICDNSVYPSALAVNPALTQIALSLRTADCFRERSRRGE